jgi:DNA repair and recombination protein RAD52
MDWDKATIELTKKLDPRHVKPPKDFGPKGSYIEGWHAMAEANRIFGFDGWDYRVISTTCVASDARKLGRAQKDGWGVSYIATVLVLVGQVRREDVGAGHGYDADLGLAHESAIKEAVTDALKRALRSFGNPFGLALYDKSRENVGVAPPAAAPPPDDAPAPDISAAIDMLNASETVEGLAAIWKMLPKDAKNDIRVQSAKDNRKHRLADITPPF